MTSRIPASDPDLATAARITVQEALAVKPGERVLIITNPQDDVDAISRALYHEVLVAGGVPNLIWQEAKTLLDPMDAAVRAALFSEPEVYISMSSQKLGKDVEGVAHPYLAADGTPFTSLPMYLIYGKKCTRGFWSPGITRELFAKTVPVDYRRLADDCRWLADRLTDAVAVRVTSPAGTEVTFSVQGRTAFVDDGNYRRAGSGGNLPAGEAYISPANGTTEGRIVYDASMSTKNGTLFLSSPITVEFEQGYIASISGGVEAEILADTIREAEDNAAALGQQAEAYRRNARHLGELGIGVNPLAGIVGSMIVDEKAARTCHFALGSNYDNDAPALIHLDGLVKEPTIELERADGSTFVLLEDGELVR